jgi:hypothetical protein
VAGVTSALGKDADEVPAALAAVTVNVYTVPFERPVTVAAVGPVVATVLPPGVAVTVYPVIVEPPSLDGALQETIASVLRAVAATPEGVVGTVAGVTPALADDAGESPTPLVAVTVNVYAVPLLNSVRVAAVSPIVVIVLSPGFAVTVYPVIADPPSSVGVVQDTAALALLAVAETLSGMDGITGPGVTGALGVEAGDLPAELVAVTVNVYSMPLVRPVTVAIVSPFVVAVCPPGLAVTMYSVTTAPFPAAGVQLIVAELFRVLADTDAGAPGSTATVKSPAL